MVVIFSIPSINRAVRVLRNTKSRAPSAACNPKCMAPLTMNRDRSPRRTTCRTFRIPGALISIAAPDMLSALRTSCTEAEETANSCPLTRKRMICSVLAELGFTGDARRISALPRVWCGKFPVRAFDSGIDVVDSKHMIYGANLDSLGRHAENHGRRFVLGEHKSAGGL